MSYTLLPISTRGAGMATVHMYQMLSTCEYFYKAVPHICKMYRAVLGLLELKLAYVQRYCNNELTEEDRQLQYVAELDTDFDEVTNCPNSISRLVNAVGFLRHETGNYVPAVHKRMFEDNRYVPRTDNILISNLRETVLALSDPSTPLVYRRNFFKNNPIPGARFKNDLLLNPDEIIPPGYVLTEQFLGDDMNEIAPQVDEMEIHFTKRSIRATTYGDDGHQCLLYTNTQGDLAIPSYPENMDINVYYTKCLPTGNITNFWTRGALNDWSDEGPLNLLGELPNVKKFMTSFYDTRNMLRWENPVFHHVDYQEICRTLYPPYDDDSSANTPSSGHGSEDNFRASPFLL